MSYLKTVAPVLASGEWCAFHFAQGLSSIPGITNASQLVNHLVMAVLARAIDNMLLSVVPSQINMVSVGELPISL